MSCWAALMQGEDYPVQSPTASKPTSSARAANTNTTSGHPGDAENAASPRDGRHPPDGKTEERDHGRASGTNHPPRWASLTKANRPQQLPNRRQRPIPGDALHQPGEDQAAGAAKGGLIPNQTVNSASPVRTSSVVRPTGPVLDNLRHRTPNPAVVGASPNSHSGHTGEISGTRMNRKP
jgi:hypothetical protein